MKCGSTKCLHVTFVELLSVFLFPSSPGSLTPLDRDDNDKFADYYENNNLIPFEFTLANRQSEALENGVD